MKIFKWTIIILISVVIILGARGYFVGKNDPNPTGERRNPFQNLFPFGQPAFTEPISYEGEPTIDSGSAPGEPQLVITPILRKITDYPVSGFVPLVLPNSETEPSRQFVRHTRKSDGFIFETELGKEKLNEIQISDSVLPTSHETFFNNSGTALVYRYWDADRATVQTYIARTGEEELKDLQNSCSIEDFTTISQGEKSLMVEVIQDFLISGLGFGIEKTGVYDEDMHLVLSEYMPRNGYDAYDGILRNDEYSFLEAICIGNLGPEESLYPLGLVGEFMSEAILDFSVSDDRLSYFYTVLDSEGKSLGYLGDFSENETEKLILSHDYSSWLSNITNKESIFLTTRASEFALGHTYELNGTTTTLTKVLGDIFGLTTLSDSKGERLLFGGIKDGEAIFGIAEPRLALTRLITPSIKTLPEKCAINSDDLLAYCGVPRFWNEENSQPDSWYMGVDLFDDDIWVVDMTVLQAVKIGQLIIDYGETIDIMRPVLSPDDSHFYFINKRDETLWSFRIQENYYLNEEERELL